MTTEELKRKVLEILNKRYPNYSAKPNGERVLLAMSVLAKDLAVKESGGNNRGDVVEAIIGSTGLDPNGGYAWCAASIEFAAAVAGFLQGPPDPASASVRKWVNWAKTTNRVSGTPARGRVCALLHPNGTGHMGIVAQVYQDGRVRTFEGNTSSGEAGSQRDGDGLFERKRPARFFEFYIDLDGMP